MQADDGCPKQGGSFRTQHSCAEVRSRRVGGTSRRYDRCHPRDIFSDLPRRSSFNKEGRRLMEDWLRRRRSGAWKVGCVLDFE